MEKHRNLFERPQSETHVHAACGVHMTNRYSVCTMVLTLNKIANLDQLEMFGDDAGNESPRGFVIH